MKRTGIFLAVLLAVLACGCVSTQSPPSAAQSGNVSPPTPDLLGTWTGTMLDFDQETGSADSENITVTMFVSGQKDRVFTGSLEWTMDGNRTAVPVVGVISRNGRSFSMLGSGNDYIFGEIVATDELELTNLNTGSTGRISISSLKRQ